MVPTTPVYVVFLYTPTDYDGRVKPKVRDLVKQLEDAEVLKELREQGLVVRKRVPFIRKTFEVEATILKEFMELARKRGYKIKEAVHEALADWVKKNDK